MPVFDRRMLAILKATALKRGPKPRLRAVKAKLTRSESYSIFSVLWSYFTSPFFSFSRVMSSLVKT
jgi:hypothetical protein